MKLFLWTNFHEKHSVIYDLSTSAPVQAIQRQSTMINIKGLPQTRLYSLSFYRLSDQLTCNNISLMALQPQQRKWHLVIFSWHIPSLHATKFGNNGASTRLKLIICICLTPFSSWAPSVHGIWTSQWYQRLWTHLRIMQIKFISCTHWNRRRSYFYFY